MKHIALGLVVTGLISSSAWAQEPAEARLRFDRALTGVSFATATAPAQDAAEAEKPVSVTVGADIPSDYFFRGFALETEGAIVQPYVDVGFALTDAVSLNVGYWMSLHSSDSTGTGFEGDPYVSLGITRGSWSTGVLYTAYLSPNDSFGAIHELAFSASHDSPLAPSIMLATELSNADLGEGGGTYLELGVEPAVPTEGAISLSVPVVIGLGMNDYYGKAFGYFSAGLAAGIELDGGFEVHAGLSLLFLGDALKYDDKTVKPVFNVGFSYAF